MCNSVDKEGVRQYIHDVNTIWGPELLVGSVLASVSCLMQHRGFDPPLRRIFPVEGIFPLELTCVLTPFAKNSFR